MAFTSQNELHHFDYEDAVVTDIRVKENTVCFTVEALIVAARNTQNTNYTNSYASTATMTFTGASITRVTKEGYRYYDANDVLLREIPSEDVAKTEWGALFKEFEGSYLPNVEKSGKSDADGEEYLAEIEMIEEDGLAGATYELAIRAKDVTVSWERYMNRVQK